MRWTLLLLALTLSANAQPAVDKPSEPGENTIARKVDPKLHADAIRLVEVSRAKERIQDNFKQMVNDGVKQMMEKCQRCTPEFGDEWKKRFLERSNGQTSTTILMSTFACTRSTLRTRK